MHPLLRLGRIAIAFLGPAACSSEVLPVGAVDDDAGVDGGELADVSKVDSAAGGETMRDDVAEETARDAALETTAVADAGTDGPCVTRCLVDGGVPLGYFCSVGKDCCSGLCGGPDKKCMPPTSPCEGCWKECP